MICMCDVEGEKEKCFTGRTFSVQEVAGHLTNSAVESSHDFVCERPESELPLSFKATRDRRHCHSFDWHVLPGNYIQLFIMLGSS